LWSTRKGLGMRRGRALRTAVTAHRRPALGTTHLISPVNAITVCSQGGGKARNEIYGGLGVHKVRSSLKKLKEKFWQGVG